MEQNFNNMYTNKFTKKVYKIRMSLTITNIAVHTLEFWRLRNKYNSPIAVKILVTFLRIVTIAMFMYFKLKKKKNEYIKCRYDLGAEQDVSFATRLNCITILR